MNTTTAEKTEQVAQVATNKGEVAIFKPPRLPWHDAIHERFPTVDRSAWKALVEAVYPSAKSVDSVVMALSYCKARNLDPFKRPVHIVPMWDSQAGAYCETVWPGISELRTTAFRTGQYAGCDETEFGPLTTKEFVGEVWENKRKVERTISVTFHEWARITIHRSLTGGRIGKWVGPKVLWLESYATVGKSDMPNDMWKDRSHGQLEKCAEAAALRKAFPEELGNEYAAEEMEGRRKFVDVAQAAEAARNVTPATVGVSIAAATAAAATEMPIAGGETKADEASPPELDFAVASNLEKEIAKAHASGSGVIFGHKVREAMEADANAEGPPALDGEIIPPGVPAGQKTDKNKDFLAMADYVLSRVDKADNLETVFNDQILARIDELEKEYVPDVYGCYRRHELRLGID